jgi:hypothetical protein
MFLLNLRGAFDVGEEKNDGAMGVVIMSILMQLDFLE